MLIPKFAKELAERIVQSWAGGRSHIVIVAPLTEPRDLFEYLRAPQAHGIQTGSRRYSIAYVDPADSRDEVTLVRAILEGWRIDVPNPLQVSNLRSTLKVAAQKVVDRGDIPVLLLPSFQDAIEKLTEDIGVHLRDVEHYSKLRVVVGLPLSYRGFREYLTAMPDRNVRFLHSEFGANYATELLRGYSAQEICDLLSQEGIGSEYADIIFKLSGGLPVLVDILIHEARRMTPSSLREFARAQSSRYCARFLDWLDRPKKTMYKRLVCEKLTGARDPTRSTQTQLKDHDWASLLVDRRDNLRSLMVGWACSDAYWRVDSEGVNLAFETQLETRDPLAILQFLGHLAPELRKRRDFLACELVCKFWKNVNPFDSFWEEAEEALNGVLREIESGDNVFLLQLEEPLIRWRPMVQDLARFCKAKRLRDGKLRPEEFFVQASGGIDLIRSYLQFLALALGRAKNAAPSQAIRTVLALPENILQVYCHARLSVTFWSATEVVTKELAEANPIFGNGKYQPPNVGGKLGFEDLLRVGWPRMSALPESERLFCSYGEMSRVRTLYGGLRRDGAHSIDVATQTQWEEYRACCEAMLFRLSNILFGETSNLGMADPLELLAQAMRARRNL